MAHFESERWLSLSGIINNKIDADIKSVFRAFNIENVSPTPDMIKRKINEKLFNKVSDRITSLLDFIESYIQECGQINWRMQILSNLVIISFLTY